MSCDKHKFGVRLRAEPDNQTLGRRLKGAFKEVAQAIKGITFESLMCYYVAVCNEPEANYDVSLLNAFCISSI